MPVLWGGRWEYVVDSVDEDDIIAHVEWVIVVWSGYSTHP